MQSVQLAQRAQTQQQMQADQRLAAARDQAAQDEAAANQEHLDKLQAMRQSHKSQVRRIPSLSFCTVHLRVVTLLVLLPSVDPAAAGVG